jgi:hypothetical protein
MDGVRVEILQITAPYFCAGIVVGTQAAPIIKYMLSWDERKIRDYAKKKGWKVVRAGTCVCGVQKQ